jgi:hypothetical protein
VSYLEKLWSSIIAPEWMANTGVPLLVTLLGLFVGYMFLRRQLKSDHVLRTADRWQNASLTLGTTIAQALERFELPASDPFWAESSWPDKGNLMRARADALLSLAPAELPELGKLIRDVDSVWMCCLSRARRLDSPPDKAIHRHAVRQTLRPYLEALKTQSVLLRKWEGLGPVPEEELDPAVPHIPVEDYGDWIRARKEEYQDALGGLNLVKPIGQPLWSSQT